MATNSPRPSKQLLEPMDRVSEILFGLIMVLAFTGSFSVAESGREEVRAMLLGALGCNLAWGIIDGVMYLMYVFDLRDRSGNFFYSWSELTVSPAGWMRIGMAAQRTRAYKTDLDIQRGLLVGFSGKRIDFTAYVLNAGWTDPTVVLAIGVEF